MLNGAGYDTLHALSEINGEKIKELENFLTSNFRLVQNLTCCRSDYYKQLQTFQFLPGHKTIIMALPDQIKNMESKKIKRKHEMNGENGPTHGPKNAKKAGNNQSDDELKANLINKVTVYLQQAGFQCAENMPGSVVDETSINDFQRGAEGDGYICKCRFSCPFCFTNIKVKHETYWILSNITRHLKKHLQNDVEYVVNDQDMDDHVDEHNV